MRNQKVFMLGLVFLVTALASGCRTCRNSRDDRYEDRRCSNDRSSRALPPIASSSGVCNDSMASGYAGLSNGLPGDIVSAGPGTMMPGSILPNGPMNSGEELHYPQTIPSPGVPLTPPSAGRSAFETRLPK